MGRPRLPEERPCTKCGKSSPEVSFSRQKDDTRESQCRECRNNNLKEWSSKNKYHSKRNERYKNDPVYAEHKRKRERDRIRVWKMKVLLHYGGGVLRCACIGCTVTEEEFLSVDHIYGGGLKHRREISSNGSRLFLWLISNNFPEGFRILCFNCNLSRGFRGYCPHEKMLTPQSNQEEELLSVPQTDVGP